VCPVQPDEHAFEPRPPPSRKHDREIARACVAEPLPIDHQRHTRKKERHAHYELAALRDLDDDTIGQLVPLPGH
jgi:hypothetical protein